MLTIRSMYKIFGQINLNINQIHITGKTKQQEVRMECLSVRYIPKQVSISSQQNPFQRLSRIWKELWLFDIPLRLSSRSSHNWLLGDNKQASVSSLRSWNSCLVYYHDSGILPEWPETMGTDYDRIAWIFLWDQFLIWQLNTAKTVLSKFQGSHTFWYNFGSWVPLAAEISIYM